VRHRSGPELVVDGDGAQVSSLVFELAAECGLRVRRLRPGRTSLEEIFLQAVSNPAHAKLQE
jgi:hypothetical protein